MLRGQGIDCVEKEGMSDKKVTPQPSMAATLFDGTVKCGCERRGCYEAVVLYFVGLFCDNSGGIEGLPAASFGEYARSRMHLRSCDPVPPELLAELNFKGSHKSVNGFSLAGKIFRPGNLRRKLEKEPGPVKISSIV